MLQRIIDFSLKNKFIVLLATVALVLGGIYAVRNIPLDAIPDLSDTQVIIYTPWEGQAPNIVEDQVTYPITTKMLSVPRAKVVRGYSFYGFSFVYVIFDDGTDPYWARSRVLEYLSSISGQLPKGVTPIARPGRHRRRLGVHVFHQLHQPQPRRPAFDPGLVFEISTHRRAGRVRSRVHRRLREAIPGDGGPDEAARLQPFAAAT